VLWLRRSAATRSILLMACSRPYAPNLNPEWGYLASPRVMRTARLIVLATVIGAIAGATTVFSLLDRPVTEEPVAARTLVVPDPNRPNGTSVEGQQPTEPQQFKPPEAVRKEQKVPPTPARRAPPLPSELATASTPQLSTSPGGPAEAPAVKEPPSVPTLNDTVTIAADPTPSKAQSSKPRMTARSRTDASRYVRRRYNRYFDGPRYGYDPGYGSEPRYGSRRSFAWEQYWSRESRFLSAVDRPA